MVKNAKYHVSDNGKWEVVHYETSDKMVKFLDENGSEIGTLQDLANGGKVLTGVDPAGINYSGVYRINAPVNAPEMFGDGKVAILAVQAVGAVGNPDFKHLTLIHQGGSIFNNTVVGAVGSGWTAGGKSLDETVSGIEEVIGKISILSTSSKEIVGSINEVHSFSKTVQTNLDNLKKDYETYKNHNHDTEYVKLAGGDMTGNLSMLAGKSLQFRSAQGTQVNFSRYSADTGYILGDGNTVLNVASKGNLTHNGKKIWTESNDGKGSGLDADKFQGVAATGYALLSRGDNKFTGDISVWSGKSLLFKTNGTNSGIFWRDERNNTKASIKHGGNGSILFANGGTVHQRIESNGVWTGGKPIELNAANNQCHFKIKLSSSDEGMGMYRNTNSKYLGFYNWKRDKRLAYFDEADDTFNIDYAPRIQGRRLWLQSGTPSGSHKTGDIWIS